MQSWCKCLHRCCCVESNLWLFSYLPLDYLGGAISSVTFNYILLWFSNRLPIFFGLKINIFGSSLVCVEINILYLIWSLKLKLCLLFDVEPGARWSSLRNWNHQQRRLMSTWNRHVNRRLLLLNVFFFKWCQGILLGWYFAEIEF